MTANDDVSKERPNGDSSPVLPVANPSNENGSLKKATFHPAVYIATWIALSSSVIVFNKYILDRKKLDFPFPIFLTTWHLLFATVMTQILARFTTVLDSRKDVHMTGRVYLRAIVPIAVFFSLSLIASNQSYLYLSVAFIQMLKATTPVVVLITTWVLGAGKPCMNTLLNVSVIVVGVIIASIGEILFDLLGFMYQSGGIIFESIRLVMMQRLLSNFKMDPLVSLFYFAPACAIMNGVVFVITEFTMVTMEDIFRVGVMTLIANATIAFLLNVSVVLLIGKTSSLVLTLSGVLKDILLVTASVIVLGDPISGLQLFGYSIALCGLIYHKVGIDHIKDHISAGRRSWDSYGNSHPILSKVFTGVLGFTIIVALLVGLNVYRNNIYSP